MLFNNRSHAFTVGLLLITLSGCAAIDRLVEPLFDEEDRDAQTEGAETERENDVSAEEQQEQEQESEQNSMPDILSQAGPNPYYAQSAEAGAAAQSQFKRGIAAMKAEDWSRAEGIFSNLSDQNPKLSGPLLNLGIAQQKQEKLELAQQNFEAAIKANSKNQEAYNQLALLHRTAGRFQEAKNLYQRAINVWPAYQSIRVNLGILYELYLGDLSKALQQYEIYQSLLPEPDRKVTGWIADLKRRLSS